MRPLTSLRNLFFTFFAFFAAFCAPGQMPPGSSGTTGLCSNRVGPWSDCKTRCLPQEQLYAQCSSKLGVLFSTRSGLAEVQTYGWTFDPVGQCGVPSARIWKLKQIVVSKAITGYLSLPDVSTPDCTRAHLDDLATETDRIYYTGEDVTTAEAAYLDSMSTAITPASPTQIVQTFNAPADGDIANAASVNVAFQSLENSVEALRFLTYGGGFYPRVKATSNTVMTIQPLGAVIVKVSGVWTAVPHSVATTIDPLALAGGAFAANTRYYVYANVVAGSIVWSVSTTAPDAGYRYKTGDEQYQFVTTFYTDDVPNLLIYSQSGKTYTYGAQSAVGIVKGNYLGGGSALVPTAISVLGPVPSGFTACTIAATASAGAANATATLGRNAIGVYALVLQPPNGGFSGGEMTKDGTATTFNYSVDAATTAVDLWAIQFVL